MNVFACIVAVTLILCLLSLIVGCTAWCLSRIISGLRK